MNETARERRNMTKQEISTPGTPFPAGVGKPALRALAAAGYTHLEQLAGVTEASLLELHGIGPKAMGILREALKGIGLSFADQG
jgi:hypothetical protein